MQSNILKTVPPEALKQRHIAPRTIGGPVPTLSVKLKDGSHKEAIVINRSDFDPNRHDVMDEDDAKEEAMEALGEPTEDDDEVDEYKVYREFDYSGLTFEKNAVVKLRKKLAKELSKKYRCIWPASESEKIDSNPKLRDALLRGLGGVNEERDPASEKQGA